MNVRDDNGSRPGGTTRFNHLLKEMSALQANLQAEHELQLATLHHANSRLHDGFRFTSRESKRLPMVTALGSSFGVARIGSVPVIDEGSSITFSPTLSTPQVCGKPSPEILQDSAFDGDDSKQCSPRGMENDGTQSPDERSGSSHSVWPQLPKEALHLPTAPSPSSTSSKQTGMKVIGIHADSTKPQHVKSLDGTHNSEEFGLAEFSTSNGNGSASRTGSQSAGSRLQRVVSSPDATHNSQEIGFVEFSTANASAIANANGVDSRGTAPSDAARRVGSAIESTISGGTTRSKATKFFDKFIYRESLVECARSQRLAIRTSDGTGRDSSLMGELQEDVPETISDKALRLVLSLSFEMFMAFVILSNSAFMGIQIHFAIKDPKRNLHAVFYVIGYTYTSIFTVELALRMVAFGCKGFFLSPLNWHWHLLDACVVAFALMEVVFDMISLLFPAQGEGGVNLSNVRVVRLIRITRLIKVFRVARIVRFVRALRTLVYSILCTLKQVVWAMLLLTMIIYVFGMVFAQGVSDWLEDNSSRLPGLELYWGDLFRCMFTLFKAICGGVSWHEIVMPLSALPNAWVFLFICYFSFTFFAVLNVITGVFCEAAIESARQDHEMVIHENIQLKNKFVNHVRTLFMKSIDQGEGGLVDEQEALITFSDLSRVLSDENTVAFLASLDLDVGDAWELFKLLDTDDSNSVDINEFVNGCMRLKGQAKAIDIAKISYDNKMRQRRLQRFMQLVEDRLSFIYESMSTLVIDQRGEGRHLQTVHKDDRHRLRRSEEPILHASRSSASLQTPRVRHESERSRRESDNSLPRS